VESVVSHIRERELSAQLNEGVERTAIGLLGEVYEELQDELTIMPGVIEDFRISKPYKLASREFHDTDTIVHIGESKVPIGAGHFTIFARPCARESKEQTVATAKAVKEAGGQGTTRWRIQATDVSLQLQGYVRKRTEYTVICS
jgi:3-deoxy-7-phosphoheptulonate synthase